MAAPPNTEELLRRIAALEADNEALRAALPDVASHASRDGSAAHAIENELRAEKKTLELLNQTGAELASELNLDRLVQIVTDAGVQLVGAAYGAFFSNVVNADGQQLTLAALSGAPREAFSRFPLPGRTPLFGATLDTNVVRSDDVMQDPRYGQDGTFKWMPPGPLPVRSYLSVPVVTAAGEVLGALFFGHPEPGVFNERAERLIKGIAAEAAIAFDHARLLQTVQRNERRFRALIEHSTDGIVVLNAQQQMLYLSPSVTAIEGYTPEELVGRSGVEHIHPEDVPAVQDVVRRLLEKPGASISFVLRRRHKDGHWLWLESVATNLLHDPAVCGIVVNYRDITLRKRSEESQIRTQKMEALGTLAGGIAHDFNNILLAITGNVRLAIEDSPADHRIQQSLGEIDKASRRATDLVGRILAFSRQQESEREIVSLPTVVQEALDFLRSSLPATIAIQPHFTHNTPTIAADTTQVHQIVMNLATNAAHAIGDKPGAIEVRVEPVTVTAEIATNARELKEGRYVQLSMRDTGSGMSSAVLQRIFDPFFTTKPIGQGTGLGLSVVDGIVKNHGGAITIKSQPGIGTTVRVYFPVAAQDKAIDNSEQAATPQGQGQRVLYVDDDEAIVYLTARVLKRLGYEVTGITDPKQALETFRASVDQFDVVVTDLAMPGMSGFDLAKELLMLRADVPILMTSGYVRAEDRESARVHGIRDVLLKPNSVEDLGRALDRTFKSLNDPE